MAFEERFCLPRDGHELACLDGDGRRYWCIRCGVLRVEPVRHGEAGRWEAPSPSGRTRSTVAAPPCLPSTGMGTATPAGDARLMLHALTHGWRCEPVLLPGAARVEAWRWWRDDPLGVSARAVVGAWADGPVVDAAVRAALLATTD